MDQKDGRDFHDYRKDSEDRSSIKSNPQNTSEDLVTSDEYESNKIFYHLLNNDPQKLAQHLVAKTIKTLNIKLKPEDTSKIHTEIILELVELEISDDLVNLVSNYIDESIERYFKAVNEQNANYSELIELISKEPSTFIYLVIAKNGILKPKVVNKEFVNMNSEFWGKVAAEIKLFKKHIKNNAVKNEIDFQLEILQNDIRAYFERANFSDGYLTIANEKFDSEIQRFIDAILNEFSIDEFFSLTNDTAYMLGAFHDFAIRVQRKNLYSIIDIQNLTYRYIELLTKARDENQEN